jgi:hypothetical protein
MPIQPSAFRLPSGAGAVRADCSGTISKEDAEAWLAQTDPGGSYHGLPILTVTLDIEHLEHEARRAFARRPNAGDTDSWIAVVVTNLVMRITQNKKQRSFPTEGEAVAWLDERVRTDAARKAGP